jgi:hypothetical protein
MISAAIFLMVLIRATSVQRLQPQNFGAVIIAGPERHRPGRIIDKDAPDVGRPRQQIFDRLSAAGLSGSLGEL